MAIQCVVRGCACPGSECNEIYALLAFLMCHLIAQGYILRSTYTHAHWQVGVCWDATSGQAYIKSNDCMHVNKNYVSLMCAALSKG